MFWEKSILTKIMLGIGVPIVLVLCLTAAVILGQVNRSLEVTLDSELQAKSQAASYQASEFFTKYFELVRQIGCNETVVQMLREIHRPGAAIDAPSYQAAAKSLDRVLDSDGQISLVWTADFDSGESVRSGGVVRGMTTDYDITTRDWYQQVMNHQDVFLTEPYVDSSTGQTVASVICPVFDGSQ